MIVFSKKFLFYGKFFLLFLKKSAGPGEKMRLMPVEKRFCTDGNAAAPCRYVRKTGCQGKTAFHYLRLLCWQAV